MSKLLKGCDGVFHMAAVVPGIDSVTSEAEIEEVAIRGTVNVLESCEKTRPKRIVLTSSFITMNYATNQTPDPVYDETCFTDVDVVSKNPRASPYMKAYARGKTLAEEAAWDFVKKHGLNMVVMNPCMIAGPVLQPSLNATNEFPVNFLSGKLKVIQNSVNTWVGIKDVAKAHVVGYENPKAEGLYLLAQRVLHNYEFADILKKLFPQYTVEAAREESDAPRAPMYSVSTKKASEQLGIEFQPFEDVLQETIECFRRLKYLD